MTLICLEELLAGYGDTIPRQEHTLGFNYYFHVDSDLFKPMRRRHLFSKMVEDNGL